MEIKTVGLDRDAYDRLRAEKRDGESFSDVVKRLTRKRRPLTDFAGSWNDLPPADVRAFDEAFAAVREEGRKQADRAFRRWEDSDASR